MRLLFALRRAASRATATRARTATGALCVAAAVPFAYHVREHEATLLGSDGSPPSIAENERVEKRWELEDGAYAVNRVRVGVPGLVYVTHEPQEEKKTGSKAHVRVTGDSQQLVECVEVVPLPPNGVTLRFKSKECKDLRGHLLTSLVLAKERQVNELSARTDGVVVVEDGVLVSDCKHATMSVELEGKGDMHVIVKDVDVNLKKLRLSVLGSGTMEFLGPENLTVSETTLLEVAGSGTAKLFAGHIESTFLKSSIAGSGDVLVAPSNGLRATKLKTSIAGSGKAAYAGDGECRVQRCSVAGSGNVSAPGIRSGEGSVEALGECKVTWNIVEKLKASGWSSTTIEYVDAVPKVVEGKSMKLRPVPDAAKEVKTKEPSRVPTREDAFRNIEAVFKSGSDSVKDEKSAFGRAVRYSLHAFMGSDEELDDGETRQERRERRRQERERRRDERRRERDY